ncbi:YtxH domain-containing protein [Streptococcus cameli]
MAKKLNLLTSVVLGIAGGTAAAVFLASESGKKLKSKLSTVVKDYQENPESVHTDIVNKAQDLKNQAVDKYTEVKEQFETGELTIEDLVQTGKQKAQLLKEQSLEKFDKIKEQLSDSVPAEEGEIIEVFEETEVDLAEDIVVQDEIEIDLES